MTFFLITSQHFGYGYHKILRNTSVLPRYHIIAGNFTILSLHLNYITKGMEFEFSMIISMSFLTNHIGTFISYNISQDQIWK